MAPGGARKKFQPTKRHVNSTTFVSTKVPATNVARNKAQFQQREACHRTRLPTEALAQQNPAFPQHKVPYTKVPSAKVLAKQLAVSAGRARLIRVMLVRLLAAHNPEEVTFYVLHRVVARTGRPTKPTTKFGELTALKVAAGLAGVTLDKLVFRRALRRVKKQLALHVRKKAPPLPFPILKKLMGKKKIPRETRLGILFAWALGLRLGTLRKIRCGHLVFLKNQTVCRVRVVAWKGHDLEEENLYKFFPLTGLFRQLRPFLVRRASCHPRLLVFDRSVPRRAFRALKAESPDFS